MLLPLTDLATFWVGLGKINLYYVRFHKFLKGNL